MNRVKQDLVNETVISTPKPRASSTVERKQPPRNVDRKCVPIPINYSSIEERSSRESLGILSIDDVDLAPQLEKPRKEKCAENDAFARLAQQRLLAQNTLNKASKVSGLPSRFLVPSDSIASPSQNHLRYDSTISESDLLKGTKIVSDVRDSSNFNPNNVSTPRSSNVDDKTSNSSVYENITRMSEKLRNSDISLQDICAQLSKFSMGSLSAPQEVSEEIDSKMFTPSELATEKLKQDELAWKNERADIPTENGVKDSILSTCANSTAYSENYSVGDFFKRKTEEVSDTFFKTSPERKDPVPLIDVTNTCPEIPEGPLDKGSASSSTSADLQNDSVLSVSQIAKILANADSQDTPTKVVNYLLKKGPSKPIKLSNYGEKYMGLTSHNESSDYLFSERSISNMTEKEQSILSMRQYHGSESSLSWSVGTEVEDSKRNLEQRKAVSTLNKDKLPKKQPRQSLDSYDKQMNKVGQHFYGRQSEGFLKAEKTNENNFRRHGNFDQGLENCGRVSDDLKTFKAEITKEKDKRAKTSHFHNRKTFEELSVVGQTDSQSINREAIMSPDALQENPSRNTSEENKENLSQSADRSMTSLRSGSSLDTLPEGKFPIKSTRTELAWGCLKLGRSNTQEFFIRNQLHQRIRMQASVTGSSFRILKDRTDSEMITSMTFVLHAMETKSFFVNFCPTACGASSEKLHFYPIINGEVQYNKRQILVLYGYGGHATLDISNIAKDPSGKLWLSLGKLDHKAVLTQKFVVRNSGTLDAFACLDIGSKGLYAFSVLYVQPKEFVLKSHEKVTITITYTPAKQDFRNAPNAEVVEIGYLKIISGAEPLRGRLRRLYSKLKQSKENVDPLLERLSEYYPDENMPADLRLFKETVGVTKELLQQLIFKEITLTLEQDLEHTLVGDIDINETSMYQTLVQEIPNSTVVEDVSVQKLNGRQFQVEPTSILLTPPIKIEDTILLHSENARRMPFEVTVEPNNVFQVRPKEGIILPGETAFLKVSCISTGVTGKDVGKIFVYVENEVMEVSIKCVLIKHKSSNY